MLKSILAKIFFIFTLIISQSHNALAEEYIELFDSDITVNADGSLDIKETITVHHEGILIKHGIIRGLSTKKGESYEIKKIYKDNISEPWHLEKRINEYKVYIGSKDTLLPFGVSSTYTIIYKMNYALKSVLLRPYNELYLNVTGLWDFPIKQATVSVRYPENTKIVSQYGYQTGYNKQQYEPGDLFIFKNINMNEEATIGQIIEKGTVNVQYNKVWVYIIAALTLMILYYLLVWYLFGRDPTPRAIVPDWSVPHDLTPLDCAYIINNGAEPKNGFFIHILWLIEKKVLNIREIQKGQFSRIKGFDLKLNEDAPNNHSEIKMFLSHFKNGLTIYDNEPDEIITKYADNLNNTIADRMEKYFFHKRTILTFIGALFLPLTWVLLSPESGKMIVSLILLPIILILSSNKTNLLYLFITCLMISPALIFYLIKIISDTLVQPSWLIIAIIYIAIVFIFKYLMFQPTTYGQRQKEKVLGLKMFLQTINGAQISAVSPENENDQYKLSKEKRLTPEDMEDLFCYAVALGLEKEWEKKFKDIFGAERYNQSVSSFDLYDCSYRSFNSLRNYATVAASYTSPTSPYSSGSGGFGGGFSGGGFGGGHSGGW